MATGRKVRETNSGGGEIFRTRLDRPWAHTTYCIIFTGSFLGGKAAEALCCVPSSYLLPGYGWVGTVPPPPLWGDLYLDTPHGS
jgi:hypothetical protein